MEKWIDAAISFLSNYLQFPSIKHSNTPIAQCGIAVTKNYKNLNREFCQLCEFIF